ncbi:AsmA family protein [Luteimonas sp. MC1825]|uniref:AsmA family protein n=1 Tax=Luteimonas sp. MC1825 TaxID=2761107 RepID=UPI00160B639E|nr:AsmA family protein [Luteimonas sp. MC1825]MBB6598522.1 AsmA family protein [Luteimonas sp. MC1825]QOC88708.1 AsmA family protein [Luteimonas sp. MC1825]
MPPETPPPAAAPPPRARPRALDAVTAHPWRTLAGALAVAIVALVLLWDWNWFKGPLERIVAAKTGRSFEIGGDLDVDLGRITVVRAGKLRLGNADWSDEPMMATADQLELHVRPFTLLPGRQARIPELRLTNPDLLLEKGDKAGNWVFPAMDGDGPGPAFERLWVDDGRLRFIDAKGGTDIDLAVASRAPKDSTTAPPITLKGSGHWRGEAFTLSGAAASPLALQAARRPYAIDLRAAAGATRAHARGTVTDPVRMADFDLRMALSGRNLEDLYPLIGVALPPTAPYALDGRFTRDGTTWHYDDFTGKVGDSDLGGSASVTTGGERLMLRANLHSARLDFDDLAGFVGAAPQSGGGETSNPELKAQAAKQAASGRLLPDTPYALHKLRAMDADVRWKAARIQAPGWPLDDMDAHIKLQAGQLRLDPLDFGVAGGTIRSTIRMDARKDVIRTDADIQARRLDLAKLFPNIELTRDAVGRVGGNINIAGNGNSIADMLGSADGDIALGMGRGQVSNLLMELAGIDIYEALKFLIGKDRRVAIRCAFGDFSVKDGLMTSRALAFDTSDTIIVGEGTIDLGDERLDLLLKPRPKDRSFLSLRSPLVLDGSFRDPRFRPDMGRLGLRGAIALALASIAPPAALLATLELGGGEDSGCGGDYAK